MGSGDKITQEIFKAVDILVSQKIKDTSYTQTIKCQVKERIKNSDMYIVLFKSEEIRVMSMGATYDKGDKVVVLLPDKNSLSPKFILGRTNDRTPTITVGPGGEISQAILKEIQDALNVIADIASDNVVSASEKGALAIQWKNVQISYEAQIREATLYGDAVSTEALTGEYNELKAFIEPILANMEVSTPVSGIELRDKFGKYYTQEQIVRALILEEIKKNIGYRVEVLSSNGINFTNGNIETTISAEVYRGKDIITPEIQASSFIWTKILGSGVPDSAWNASAVGIGSSFNITSEDIDGRATFKCEIQV